MDSEDNIRSAVKEEEHERGVCDEWDCRYCEEEEEERLRQGKRDPIKDEPEHQDELKAKEEERRLEDQHLQDMEMSWIEEQKLREEENK